MKSRIALVAGTRPEVVKLAPIYFALKGSASLDPVFLSTAQHRQMLDQAFQAFDLVPEFDLNLMQPKQGLAELTSRVLAAVHEWLGIHQPAAILLQGDTTTVLASALAAFYRRIPFGHVEAGLRTGDMSLPYPEEMNRRLTSPLAKWHFCPTELSKRNLNKEGITENVFTTGNTVVDALLLTKNKIAAEEGPMADKNRVKTIGISDRFASTYMRVESKWILLTGHRRESFGDGFERICDAIKILAVRYHSIGFLYPVHLNPQVREPIHRLLDNIHNIELIEPVDYQNFVWLMNRCYFICSDSGGVQEEAPSLGKPVLVMRDETERPEGVEAGTCILVGTNTQRIVESATRLIEDEEEYRRRSVLKNPYGEGDAALKIVEILERSLAE